MASYPLNPPLECDVIMKGGITSGVIYPGAVCELAKAYRLRSIGGASAGAIAAAAAAAAECGRATGGFELLEQLPHDLTALPGTARATGWASSADAAASPLGWQAGCPVPSSPR